MRVGRHEIQNQETERSRFESHKAASIQISTGFDKLDAVTGGFSAGELIVLGDTIIGKNSSFHPFLASHSPGTRGFCSLVVFS